MPPDGRAHVTVRRIAVDDAYVRVSTMAGPGSQTFVLVPGLGIASTYFERLAPRLARHGTVHALDLPGFAGVPAVDGPYRTVEAADAVIRVLRGEGIEQPVLIGHSLGTQIAAEVAGRHPVRLLVLISPVVAPPFRHAVRVVWRFVRSSVHEPFGVVSAAITSYVTTGLRGFLRVLPELLAYRLEDRLAAADPPLLVITGGRDRLQTRPWLAALASQVTRAGSWTIRRSAHSVMHRAAGDVADLIADALTGELRDGVRPGPRARPLPSGMRLRTLRVRIAEMTAMRDEDDARLARVKTAKLDDVARRGLL
jgi:pimeloyl-ACP methyl ester carboxylesterase